ncbi:HET-domain-containing protein [Apiospora aurea]|uniref:HET-domain-containing protein n=1 Tax=Apiospora aurea TaxID=335848 RepID=A0ABR1QI52_9PEZI
MLKHFKKATEVPCEQPLPPYPYLPLQGDEIRLLTVNPGSPDLESASQISCSLQHVDLPGSRDSGVGGGVADSGRHRGYARDWPELQTAPDSARLLKIDSWVQKQALSKYDEKSQQPYWRRMWILQEVAMAHPEAPVLCGGKCLSWAEIRDAAALITADEERFGRLVTGTLPSTWNFEIGQARLSERRHLSPERLWRLMIELLRVQSDQNDASLPGVATDILRPLLLARDAAVTQEKDRVYGILGIRAVAERVSLVPDYTLPLADNFQSFSSALLQGGNMDLLRLVSLLDKPIYTKGSLAGLGSRVLEAAPCVHNLPSWVICWTCAALPAAHLRAPYRAGGKPTVESQSAVVISDSCLRIQGLIVDTIVSLGTCHPAEATDDYPVSGSKGSNNLYGGLDETREALWRTMVGDSIAQGDHPAPEEYSWLLDPRIWRDAVSGVFSHGLGLESVMKRNGSLELGGYSLKELIFGPGRARRPWGERYYNSTKTQREALAWAVDVLAWRRLMSTEAGRLGLAPASAAVGDKIVIFPGCDVPMVLRRRDAVDGWRLVGESYVHGFMEGEALQKGVLFSDIDIY